ncbi:alpha/beta hydrolase fold domain-containing protein [Kineococcus sp. T13]|uniref:alpha/beta hydrolase n=1 Tax=Kineococcus vitellinus TaxID=2696565 RepID=UPI00141249B4|nr:alpha/beta hydrolase [Kineococcus vitellinus]NAZ76585.1 alpha/beta hydrolase fold domain-containing protein [Kineococcus vitellinus]
MTTTSTTSTPRSPEDEPIHSPAGSPAGPPVPFDPEAAAALAAMGGFPPITPDLIPVLRQGLPGQEPPTDADLTRDGAFEVEERTVPGPAGAPEVRLLTCRPTRAGSPAGTTSSAPAGDSRTASGAVYWIHGGGMIVGDNRGGVDEALDWAQELGLAVISVDYRLAPETPHPGPVEDCYAGLVWSAEHAGELGIDPQRIVVAGASAGGGLAAAVALMARDRRGPALAGQLLIYPMIDDRNDSPSAVQMADSGTWGRTANDTGWNALLGSARGSADVSAYAAPARASDLSGLPPAFIDVASAENFRDEDVAYASRIWQAGGIAELHVWPGGFHGFDVFAPHAGISREARAARLRWLHRLLEA